jgi:NADH-quinone oxidoreductase subunit G
MATVNFTIDGRQLTVEKGTNILEAARVNGIDIPHFCYHPMLEIVGSCRMCQVEVEKSPKLLISCATPAQEGMVVHTKSERVKKAQKAVLEFLLANHPLDCPICDKGGECPLQDYTYRYGPGESRMVEPKVKRLKATPYGPTIVFDAERCVLCSRCVRFLREVPKTGELGIFSRGDRSCVSPFPGREINNNLSGNLTELCPVGALTSREYRFKSRPWDLVKLVDTTCPNCSTGCSITLELRFRRQGYPEVLRVRPKFNPAVNGFWICDQGRWGMQYLQSEARLRRPLIRQGGHMREVPCEEALPHAFSRLTTLLKEHGPQALGVILSSGLTNEELFLAQKFFREVVGTDNIDHQVREVQQEGRDAAVDPLYRKDRTPNTAGARFWGAYPQNGGWRFSQMMEAAQKGQLKILVLLGESLQDSMIPAAELQAALSKVELIISWDLFLGEFNKLAHVIIPATSFAEKEGTFTNCQGKVQMVQSALNPWGDTRPLELLFKGLAQALGKPWPYIKLRDAWPDMAAKAEVFKNIDTLRPIRASLPQYEIKKW